MKTAVIHRTKLILLAICLFAVFGIKGSASAYSFEEDFFASEPEVTEVVDTTRGIKYKGLVGEIRLTGEEGGGRRVKRSEGFYNGTAYVFLNIPYAQKLTPVTVFELPTKLEDNSSMIARNENETNYRRFGNYCPQESGEREKIYAEFCHSQMDIDCLNLNVFSPELDKEDAKDFKGFPVYVLLHGGKFSHGSACDFGRPGLVHNFVREKIVVVTLNYRLGLYGFHKKDKSDKMSNRGLYDQKMALEWVRDNIKSFKGDPKRVVLGGFDSGACSAAMMTLVSQYDRTFALFDSVILHAGTADVCRKGGVFDQIDIEVSPDELDELRTNVSRHNELTAQYDLGMQYQVPDDIFDEPIKMVEKAVDNTRNLKVLMGLNLYEFVAFERALDQFHYERSSKEEMVEFFAEHVKIAGLDLNSTAAKTRMELGLADALEHYKTVNGTTFGSVRMMMEYVFVHNFILLARNLTELRIDVYIYRFDISPHPDLFPQIKLSNSSKGHYTTVPHGTDVRYAYLAQQYWKHIKNNTNKALAAEERKIGEDFSKEVLVPFIKNRRPEKGQPFLQTEGWDSAKFLKIDRINGSGSYMSSVQSLSMLYEEEAFDLWERFAEFRETAVAPKPVVTSGPPTDNTKQTQTTTITPKVATPSSDVTSKIVTQPTATTSTVPVDTSTAPDDTSNASVDTSKAPVDNSTVPVNSSKASTEISKTTTSLPTTTVLPTTAKAGELIPSLPGFSSNDATAQIVNGVVGLVYDENR